MKEPGAKRPGRQSQSAAIAETRLAAMKREAKNAFASYQSSSSPRVARVR